MMSKARPWLPTLPSERVWSAPNDERFPPTTLEQDAQAGSNFKRILISE
jgi:hypothetical protein